MCELVVNDRVCWPILIALEMGPVALALLWFVWTRRLAYRRALRAGRPFKHITFGPVRLCGRLRAQRGAAFLEEPDTGARVRLHAGTWPLPPPGSLVAVYGDVFAQEPDDVASYRMARSLWAVFVHEIGEVDGEPFLSGPRDLPPRPVLVPLVSTAIVLIAVFLWLGLAWPTWLNWCHCAWP